MKIEKQRRTGEHFRYSGTHRHQLGVAFREEVNSALPESPSVIEIDLSQTRFMDSSGLGALFVSLPHYSPGWRREDLQIA